MLKAEVIFNLSVGCLCEFVHPFHRSFFRPVKCWYSIMEIGIDVINPAFQAFPEDEKDPILEQNL